MTDGLDEYRVMATVEQADWWTWPSVSAALVRFSVIAAASDWIQQAASHADPRTTMRYDRARVSLDRHATSIVSTLIAGASV